MTNLSECQRRKLSGGWPVPQNDSETALSNNDGPRGLNRPGSWRMGVCLFALCVAGCSTWSPPRDKFLIGEKPKPFKFDSFTPNPTPATPVSPARGAQPTRVGGELSGGQGSFSAAPEPPDPLEALLGPVSPIEGDVTVVSGNEITGTQVSGTQVSGTGQASDLPSRRAVEAAMEAAPPEPISLQVSDLRPSNAAGVGEQQPSGSAPPRLSTANDSTPSIDQLDLLPHGSASQQAASQQAASEQASQTSVAAVRTESTNPLRRAGQTARQPVRSASATEAASASAAAKLGESTEDTQPASAGEPASTTGWVAAPTGPPALPAGW